MEKEDYVQLAVIVGVFLLFYLLPPDADWLNKSVQSGLVLLSEYAKQHVLTCLVPALFIAGAISVFIKKDKILKYLGAEANLAFSYLIASVTGAILAVCSCTILPLFAGIRKRGAGLGPAVTFLFAGPAINIAAIFLTFSVLGVWIGLGRAVASIVLSIIIGLTMAVLFKEETEKGKLFIEENEEARVSDKVLLLFFGFLVGILVVNGLQMEQLTKYLIIGLFTLAVVVLVLLKFRDNTRAKWLSETWSFSKSILPMLFIGVFIAGFIMPLIPEQLVVQLVGKNSIEGNLVASVFGAVMYFSTLTEIPILQVLIAKGMNTGPALALLLAGPSLSLPNMLVIRGILGTRKALAYIVLVVVYSTIAGYMFGALMA
ncbi:MAG: permease [Candidatus Micrarchaeia archaeon]